jgi:hypothetical protein
MEIIIEENEWPARLPAGLERPEAIGRKSKCDICWVREVMVLHSFSPDSDPPAEQPTVKITIEDVGDCVRGSLPLRAIPQLAGHCGVAVEGDKPGDEGYVLEFAASNAETREAGVGFVARLGAVWA